MYKDSTVRCTKNGKHFHIMMVQLQGSVVEDVRLNKAVSQRLQELLDKRKMTQYQLYMKTGVPKSTIGNLINCTYDSVKLRILHELCQGLEISITEFFASPIFEEDNLEP